MEEHQRTIIRRNFDKLVNLTTCDTMFLSNLIASDVLGEYDFETLKSIPKKSDRSAEFYLMIQKRENSYEKLLVALEATKQSGAAKILLQSTTASNSSTLERTKLPQNTSDNTKIPIYFEVREPARLFTGRSQEVSNLHSKIMQNKGTNPTVISQMASVTGLGGIGKTELCRRYIQLHKQDYDGNVIWINAEKEDVIANTFIRLSKDKLRIPTKDANGEDKNIQTVVDDVYQYFNGRKSLFVFDNAESGSHMQRYLPLHGAEGPYTLITSRDRDWKLSVGVLELDVLTEQDAIVFVKCGLCINDNSQNVVILKLVKLLQNFPLALQQAVSFINQRRRIEKYNIEKYLKAYEFSTEKVLNSEIPAAELNYYTKTTFTAWKMTTVSISIEPEYGRLAINILNLISYFEADDIPVKIFSKLSTDADPDDWKRALELLVKYSMVNSQFDKETISIHRLVQEVTRIELRRQNNEQKFVREALTLLEAGLNNKSVNHAMKAFEYACKHTNIVFEFSNLALKVVTELSQRPNDSTRFGLNALKILKRHHSSDNIDVIRLEFAIEKNEYNLHNYAACLPRFRDVLKRFKLFQPDVYLDGNFKHGILCGSNAACIRGIPTRISDFRERGEHGKT